MKTIFNIILILLLYFDVTAQYQDSNIKYIWKNEKSNITAAIDIYGLQQNKNSFCIFYINNVDTVYNNVSDSLFNEFANISSLNCPVVKISFYNIPDTNSTVKMKLYAEELSNFIISDVLKKLPAVKSNNFIVSGLDFYAAVVLYAATTHATKINKTALFLSETDDAGLLKNIAFADLKKLKGKMYFYVNHQHAEKLFADAIATDIALSSNVVLYKFDNFGAFQSAFIFEEAFNWLLADGNNYIIRDTH